MAERLYSLGHWASRHVWPVLLAWLLVLGAVGGAAAAFSKPLSTEFTIPGTEFQRVNDQLKSELPDAAGGVGTVVFSTRDGSEFTSEQRRAIAATVKDFADSEGVTGAENPFALQKRIDGSGDELEKGRKELASGRKEVEAGREKLEKAKADLADGRKQLEKGRKELASGRKQLEGKRTELEQAEEQLAALRAQAGPDDPRVQGMTAQLEQGRARLEAGEKELEAGQAELERNEKKLRAGQQQVRQNEKKLDDAESDLADGRTQLEQGEAQQKMSEGMRFVASSGTTAYTQIRFTEQLNSLPIEQREAVMAKADGLSEHGITTTFSEEMSQDPSSIMGPGEIIGLAVAALVLLVMLRGLLAAGLPLVNAVIGVAVGVGAAMALSSVVTMQSITPALAVMLGLAVGIDYTLFILHRHRTQMASGMDKHESLGLATGTAGNAVGVAGATVVIALAALTLTGIPFLSVMGLVAAGTVLVAVLLAWTLGPALMSLLGDRVLGRRGRAARRAELDARAHAATPAEKRAAGGATSAWKHVTPEDDHPRWTRWVTRAPWLTVAAVVAVLGTMAWPVTDMRLGMPDGSTAPAASQGYQTFDTIREEFGPGANGALVAMAEAPEGLSKAEVAERQTSIGMALKDVEGVDHVVPIGTSEDRSVMAFQITPTTGPGDAATVDTVNRLRDAATGIEQEDHVELGFTGLTVANIDVSDALASSLPLYLAVVVGLSLLLLVLVFRSLLVPLVATAGFLLSVGAAFGAVVAVYQWGWLGPVFAVNEGGPILSFLPTIVIGVLFGLAMDYQMFLVSGMREAWAHGASAREAVHKGFGAGVSVVTAAALIMVSVFAGFIHAELVMIRPMGLGLALGVLVDAFVVRMTLTPALMHLLGEKAWWMPRWLDRLLPDLDVEGTKLQRSHGVDAEGHTTA
ncbi:MMPL family transporter [Kytococcus schroeteri]|uniref:MMPL family transporter n=1 Tax=Kytococcus schroeteri TaxID=138300 RepID=UPI0035ED1F30